MVIKIKEISIGRSRKWAWDFGNSVGYTISVTVEGTIVKDTVEEMRRAAMNELLVLMDTEQERCRNVFDIAHLQSDMEFNDKVEKSVEAETRMESSDNFKGSTQSDSKALPEKTVDPEIMDLKEVTVIAHTEKAILVTKKGFQKWVPLSFVISELGEWDDGIYLDIELTEKGGWINKKVWEKLEVRKS